MHVRLRISVRETSQPTWRTGHRPLSLLYSLALHGGLIAFAFFGPELDRGDPQSVYRETIVPLEKDHKVIWYDFRKPLPEVSAANPNSKLTSPLPNELKTSQRVVTAPQERNGKQFVWLPAPKVELQTDLKTPNLIALEIPVPERPKPKAFQAPELPKKEAAKVTALPSAPAIAGVTTDKQSSAISALLDKPIAGPPPKQFTPPSRTNPAAAVPAAALPSAPSIAGITADKQSAEVSALLNRPLSGPPPKQFSPPPARTAGNSEASAAPAALPAPPSVPESGQPATASIAIVGLNPANVPQIPKPDGGRPARIMAGTPVPGATQAELGGGNGPITVPNLSIEGGRSTPTASRAPLDTAPAPPATGLAHAQAPQVLPTTPHVSVPQWPNARNLPAPVERHFQNRVVYLTLIPSQSGDDWVVWFGELHTAPAGAGLLMRPPFLLRAAALPPIPAHSDHGSGKIRVAGLIHKDGHLDTVSELAGAAVDRELAAGLQSWQFSPATRNGVPIDADAVIEIPVVFGTLSLRQ